MEKERKNTMLLAIDIGNTHTVFGFFQGKKLKYQLRLATDLRKTVDEWGGLTVIFAQSCGFKLKEVEQVVLASVVPDLNPVLQHMVSNYIKCPLVVVGPDLPLGIKFGYKNPREVGADRIANAVAANDLYPLPCIVVDMGTATTFDIILKGGIYAGGVILPGVETSLSSLTQKTALLPKIDLTVPTRAIGRTTIECMQTGIIFGTIDQINGIIARIEKELKKRCTIVLTGGWANPFARAFKGKAIFNPDLTLEGLRTILEMVMGKRK
jgi:type III pantothenate kinase